MKTLPCLLALLVPLCGHLNAQTVPPLMNYQGQLLGPGGTNLPTADYQLTFNIYDTAQGGEPVWGPQIFDGRSGAGYGPKIPVVQGYFNVMLGPTDTRGRSLAEAFATASRWVEIKVGDHNPIAPRQQILSAPYAIQAAFAHEAANAQNLAGKPVGDFVAKAGDTMTGRLSVLGVKIGELMGRAYTVGVETGTNDLKIRAGVNDYGGLIYLKTDGSVGVGTAETRDFKLRVDGNALLGGMLACGRSGSGADSEIGHNLGFTSTNNSYTYLVQDSAASIRFNDSGGNIEFRNAPYGPAGGSPLALSSRMVITRDGNVGIGTSSPLAKLHVSDGGTVKAIIGDASYETQGNASTITATPNTRDLKLRAGANDSAGLVYIGANGNVGVGTSSPSARLHVGGTGGRNAIIGDVSFETMGNASALNAWPETRDLKLRAGANDSAGLVYIKASGNVGIGTTDPTYKLTVKGNACVTEFMWAWGYFELSDRNVKEHLVPVDGRDVLDRLSRVPIQTWSFIEDLSQTRHMGPMAQDFHAAFGLGADDKHINTIDAEGVALAAIQGLHQILQEQEAALAAKEQQIEALAERVSRLERLVQSLAEQKQRASE